MNFFLKFSILVALTLIFNACSFKTNYPDSWSKLEIPKENILINGIFKCSGKMVYEGNSIKNGIVYLPSFLEMKDYQEAECDEVHIKQSNTNFIDIIIFKNNKEIEKKVLELNKNYVYNDNYILMKNNEMIQAPEVIGYSSNDKYFKLTKNNDLIIERKSSSYGVLFFVIPIIINDNYFAVFKQNSNKYEKINNLP